MMLEKTQLALSKYFELALAWKGLSF